MLYTNFGSQLYVYRPDGNPLAAGKPAVTGISSNGDGSYHLTGTLLNGISEGAAYGDDAQMASNYPIVRLTAFNGNVYYARTYNWSSTGVMTGNTPVSTEFELPAGLPLGTYSVVAVANGIASDPISLNTGGTPTPTATPAATPTATATATADSYRHSHSCAHPDTNTNSYPGKHIRHCPLLLESSSWPSAKCDAHPDW